MQGTAILYPIMTYRSEFPLSPFSITIVKTDIRSYFPVEDAAEIGLWYIWCI